MSNHFKRDNTSYNREYRGEMIQSIGFDVNYSETEWGSPNFLVKPVIIKVFGILPKGSGSLAIGEVKIRKEKSQEYRDYKKKSQMQFAESFQL